MEDIQARLEENEKVLAKAKQHPGALIVPIIIMLIGALTLFLGGGLVSELVRILGALVAIAGLWKTIASALIFRSTQVVLTDRRIFAQFGVPSKEIAVPLGDLDSADVKRDVFGAVLGYGTLVINAVGRGNLRMEFRQISHANSLAEQINDQRQTAPRRSVGSFAD